jgi:hypothetical protein
LSLIATSDGGPDELTGRSALLLKAAGFCLGFGMVANIYLVPRGAPVRLTDLFSVVCALFILQAFATRGIPRSAVWVFLAGAMLPAWRLYDGWFNGHVETVSLIARWYLALLYGYCLFQLCRREGAREAIMWGLWIGGVLNVAILAVESRGFGELLEQVGLMKSDTRQTWIYGVERMKGLHGHPNGTTAVISVICWSALYMYFKGRWPLWMLVISMGLLGYAAQMTLSRSPLLAVMLASSVAGLYLVSQRRAGARRALIAGAAIVGGALLVAVTIGPPGDWERWLDSRSTSENAGVRWSTMAAGVGFIAENPLGAALEVALERLNNTSISRTESLSFHNTFIQTAAFLGLGFAMWLYAGLLRMILRFRAADPSMRIFSVVFTISFLFLLQMEDRFGNPMFLIVAAWLIFTGSEPVAKEEPEEAGELPCDADLAPVAE